MKISKAIILVVGLIFIASCATQTPSERKITLKPNTKSMSIGMGYPAFAKSNKIEGKVTADVHVNYLGKVIGIDIISSSPKLLFDQHFIDKVSQWEFEPENRFSKKKLREEIFDQDEIIETFRQTQQFKLSKNASNSYQGNKQLQLAFPSTWTIKKPKEYEISAIERNHIISKSIRQYNSSYCHSLNEKIGYFSNIDLDKRGPSRLAKGSVGCFYSVASIHLECSENTELPDNAKVAGSHDKLSNTDRLQSCVDMRLNQLSTEINKYFM